MMRMLGDEGSRKRGRRRRRSCRTYEGSHGSFGLETWP